MVDLEGFMAQFELLLHKVTVGALIFLAIMICLAAIKASKPLREKRKLQKQSGLKRSRWSAASGLVFGKSKLGLIVNVPVKTEGIHVCTVGGTGSGKTSTILIPTLLHFKGNFFAVDISGDISAAVPAPDSITYAPCEPNTNPYNIFGLIDSLPDVQAKCEQLEKLAFLILPDQPGADGNSRFFTNGGRKILTASLIAFYFAGMDFPEICRQIVSLSCIDLFRAIDAQKVEVASMLIKSFAGTNEINTSGCKQTADDAIKLFATNQNIQTTIHRPQPGQTAFTPDVLEDASVFFRIPENMLDVYAPLLNIIVSQTFTYFANRPIGATPPILLSLDEFVSLEMDSKTIVGALQRLRKRNISILIVTQSIAALDRVYGENTRKDMMSNFSYKVILHASDPDSQTDLAKLIGHKQEKSYTKTTGHGAPSFTEKEEQIWAIEPEKLSRLGDKLVLIHPTGYELLKKAPFYKYKK